MVPGSDGAGESSDTTELPWRPWGSEKISGLDRGACLWALGGATTPNQWIQQSISYKHHRGHLKGGDGRCQVVADQIYLLAHMGLSLGTLWNSLKDLAGSWRHCISRCGWKALQYGLLPIALHSEERVKEFGETKRTNSAESQNMREGQEHRDNGVWNLYCLDGQTKTQKQARIEVWSHSWGYSRTRTRFLSSTWPSPVPVQAPHLWLD